MTEYYIGLMSGTSLDGIDAALVDFSSNTPALVRAINFPLPAELRESISTLCTPGENEIEQLGSADIQLATTFAAAVQQLLNETGIDAEQVRAIGSHGQTIRHRPEDSFTLQIGDPNTLAELTGITTVADFRRRDMAAGGQGAPLAPAFHAAMFGSSTQSRVVLNIGGMANVTFLPGQQSGQPADDTQKLVIGFDTGPGNVLMDAWVQRHQQRPYDEDGRWACAGKVNEQLLTHFLQDDYFPRKPPKSTGREHFNLKWLEQQLNEFGKIIEPVDVQATLSELTARSVQKAMSQFSPESVVVCGGGARNTNLMQRLSKQFSPTPVITSDDVGLSADWVEAVAFAWLARESLAQRPGNLPAVTGARRPVVLGGVYPAG